MSENQLVKHFGAADQSLAGVKLLEGIPEDTIHQIEEKCRWIELTPDEAVLEREDGSVDVYFIIVV
mgnify:CR=1 FL=1